LGQLISARDELRRIVVRRVPALKRPYLVEVGERRLESVAVEARRLRLSAGVGAIR